MRVVGAALVEGAVTLFSLWLFVGLGIIVIIGLTIIVAWGEGLRKIQAK